MKTQKGDTIYLKTSSTPTSVSITCQQNLKDKSVKYKTSTYDHWLRPDSFKLAEFFVQTSKLPGRLAAGIASLSMVSRPTSRSSCHRFVETNVGSGIFKAVNAPLNTAAALVPVVGEVLVEQFKSRLPSLIGHPLRERNEAAVTADDVIVVDDKYDPKTQPKSTTQKVFFIKVDSKFQYGQQDGKGNGRYLVYHDAKANPILRNSRRELQAGAAWYHSRIRDEP
ncbi:hypothetical protein A4X13_0g5099 [Tilletia indica]|uniref:Uncharacterized protein n=1 Tax=Tilletia indica TaxID=43049 RepID=A0A177T6W1_9BASI|nr:hypothetical protein A4X13_0g5099 [Tilletia indica]